MGLTALGRIIREARGEESQDSLSFRAGVSQGWLSKVETGDIDNPAADKVRKVAHALDLDPRTLFAAQFDIEGGEAASDDEPSGEARRTFGVFLRAQREARGWGREEVAARVGISLDAVDDWEQGVRRRYSPAELRAWAHCYELPLVRLLIEAGFLTHLDLVAADPTAHVNPLLILLGDKMPQLGTVADVELVSDLAWTARRWAERHGAPEVREAGQTRQVETQAAEEEEPRRAANGSSS